MEVIGKAKIRKQPWMTQEIIDACYKKRVFRATRFNDSDREKEYRDENIEEVRKEIKKAKEEFLENKCQEIQEGF